VPKYSNKLAATLLLAGVGGGLILSNGFGWAPNSQAHQIGDWLLLPFFCLIGIEIRSEVGFERHSVRLLIAPLLSAFLGAALPALVTLVITGASTAWPVPVATDLTLSLAVFALATGGVSNQWRTYLLVFAVFDDIFGILALNAGHLTLSPSLIGVVLGILLPTATARRVESIGLAPTNYVAVPVYAMVASAITLAPQQVSVVFVAILLKPLLKMTGIGCGYLLSRALGVVSRAPGDYLWVLGLGMLGGIGFTVAFSAADASLGAGTAVGVQAKVATLIAAVFSAGLAFVLLRKAATKN